MHRLAPEPWTRGGAGEVPTPGGVRRPHRRWAVGLAAEFFDHLARWRADKPIHTRGTGYDVRIRRYGGSRRWRVAWLDEPGEDVGVGRLSRAIGLPPYLPDVLGLAIRFAGPDGGRHDLLLSSTGVSRGTRHLLRARRDPVRSAYSTVLPYRGDGRSVLLMAHPRRPTVRLDGAAPAESSIHFVLAAATPGSSWDRFGILTLTRPPGLATSDPPISFDPVRHPLPGLRLPNGLAAVRAGAYAGARRGRHAGAAELDRVNLTVTRRRAG